MIDRSSFFALVMAAAAGILLFALSGCGEKKPVLHVFNWDDYLKPELVDRFEKEFGCRVLVDTFDSNESMLAKLKAGGGGYDLLVPSSYMVKILDREGLLQPLDHAKLPNLEHVDREYLEAMAFDKDMTLSVPYMMSATGIGYIEDKVENPTASWNMFDRPELKGRITLLNDVREPLAAALKLLGYSLNTTDDAQLEEAKEIVIRWKKHIAKFESDQYRAGLASNEFFLCHGYAGDLFQAQEANEKVVVVIPEEGTSVACDDLCIPKDAPNPDLAHAFVNFLTDPAVAAENSEFIYYLAPNSSAYELMSEDFRNEPAVFIDRQVFGKSEVIDDLGEEGNRKYARLWDEIKAAPVD